MHARLVLSAISLGLKNEDDVASGARNKIMFNEKCGFIKLGIQLI
jgi:hypothetical protein